MHVPDNSNQTQEMPLEWWRQQQPRRKRSQWFSIRLNIEPPKLVLLRLLPINKQPTGLLLVMHSIFCLLFPSSTAFPHHYWAFSVGTYLFTKSLHDFSFACIHTLSSPTSVSNVLCSHLRKSSRITFFCKLRPSMLIIHFEADDARYPILSHSPLLNDHDYNYYNQCLCWNYTVFLSVFCCYSTSSSSPLLLLLLPAPVYNV